MAQKRRTSKRRRSKKITIRLSVSQLVTMIVAVICLLVGVNLGWEDGKLVLPTWSELYDAFDLSTKPQGSEQLSDETQAIHFIDVGQGDATLLQSGDTYCLVDAGESDSQEALLAYLEEQGVEQLALVVMTHPHADHIGGMRAVLEQIPVEQVLLPVLDNAPYPTTRTFERVMETIEKKQIPTVVSEAGQTFSIGEGVLEVLLEGMETDNYNNLSQVLYYKAPGLSAVLSGDAEADLEQLALQNGAVKQAQIFKAAHHGSNTSNTWEFLQSIQPEWIVISCGKDNSYGHPHREPMERYQKLGAAIFRTDQDGSVILAATENGIESYTTNAA